MQAGCRRRRKRAFGIGYEWFMAGLAVVLVVLLVAIVSILVMVFRRR